MNKLLIATTNQGKIAELTRLLRDLPFAIVGLNSLAESFPPVEETGSTFAENALLKADYYHARSKLLTLADDSGLEVDALNGMPGIYSARYAGENATDAERIEKLLNELSAVSTDKRTARFKCCIALAGTDVREVFEGSCEGLIADAPRGTKGFGYDPIFLERDLNRTFAELSKQEKDHCSHRGKALRAVRKFLSELKSVQN